MQQGINKGSYIQKFVLTFEGRNNFSKVQKNYVIVNYDMITTWHLSAFEPRTSESSSSSEPPQKKQVTRSNVK